MVKPLGPWVWVFMLLSIVVMPVIVYTFQVFLHLNGHTSGRLSDSFWFTFATFLGENSLENTYVQSSSWAIR